ncbi:uncharacterized protein LOC125679812 isoform X1 [Ostrea edulis]|uniref:uncharacterized protein LOC125679812 isoform X1 n=1 Tax=Ostrea edulis TaxID=37623 RepID=UPI0024AFDE73|nr:uncharacterized protein LOC125679812 isoform X1 [Ostrea edulis]XP_056017871.1 uncharacterized protein LOC125679812 isoform X1 [Ostrea edulis]
MSSDSSGVCCLYPLCVIGDLQVCCLHPLCVIEDLQVCCLHPLCVIGDLQVCCLHPLCVIEDLQVCCLHCVLLKTSRFVVYALCLLLKTSRFDVYTLCVLLKTSRFVVYIVCVLLKTSRFVVYALCLLLKTSRFVIYTLCVLLKTSRLVVYIVCVLLKTSRFVVYIVCVLLETSRLVVYIVCYWRPPGLLSTLCVIRDVKAEAFIFPHNIPRPRMLPCIIHESKNFISILLRLRNIQPIVYLYYELGHCDVSYMLTDYTCINCFNTRFKKITHSQKRVNCLFIATCLLYARRKFGHNFSLKIMDTNIALKSSHNLSLEGRQVQIPFQLHWSVRG